MTVGVVISTTGSRPDMVDRAYRAWAATGIDHVFVTTDHTRQGPAWNKNRGLAVLMDVGVDHLFLADDDMYPLGRESWERYVEADAPHLMLCWGKRRRVGDDGVFSWWTWPRGVLLYQTRAVVETVGGMRGVFRNGHEHAEYSQRIHNTGLTRHPFMDLAQNPRDWFHCEDWGQPGETLRMLGARRRRVTTIHRTREDTTHNKHMWDTYSGSTGFVRYR